MAGETGSEKEYRNSREKIPRPPRKGTLGKGLSLVLSDRSVGTPTTSVVHPSPEDLNGRLRRGYPWVPLPPSSRGDWCPTTTPTASVSFPPLTRRTDRNSLSFKSRLGVASDLHLLTGGRSSPSPGTNPRGLDSDPRRTRLPVRVVCDKGVTDSGSWTTDLSRR